MLLWWMLACGEPVEQPAAPEPVEDPAPVNDPGVPAEQVPKPEMIVDGRKYQFASPSPDPLAEDPPLLTSEERSKLAERLRTNEPLTEPELHQIARGGQLTYRAWACSRAGELGDEDAVPWLIDHLHDDSAHVGIKYAEPGGNTTRWHAHGALKKLTDQDFGYAWDAPEEDRTAAAAKWAEWWRARAK